MYAYTAICVPGHVALIKILLQHGARLDAADEKGRSPLHNAAQRGHVAAVELLVTHGAQVTAQDAHGHPPLHSAACKGHVAVVQLLLRSHAWTSAILVSTASAAASKQEWGTFALLARELVGLD